MNWEIIRPLAVFAGGVLLAAIFVGGCSLILDWVFEKIGLGD